MLDKTGPFDDVDPDVVELLQRWHREETGEKPTPEALCAARPDLLGEVRKHIAALAAADAILCDYDNHATIDQGTADRSAPPPQPTMPPIRFGNYLVNGALGEGGMGTVCKARDPLLDRDVAIKVLKSGLSDTATARLLREARAAARLAHPNVVSIYHVVEENGRIQIVMELLGKSLADELNESGTLPWRTATLAIRDAAAGIAAAHDAGMVHRDIKPSNLLRGLRGEVKVVDFGIVHSAEAVTLTAPGSMMGTPAFMAPEQCRGEQADARSDVYSLACTYYNVLTGRLPFDGTSAYQVMRMHETDSVPDPGESAADIPAGVRRIIAKAGSKESQLRYKDAAEMLADLDAVLGGGSPAVGGANRARSAARGRGIGATVALGLVVLALVAVMSIGWRWIAHRTEDLAKQSSGDHLPAQAQLPKASPPAPVALPQTDLPRPGASQPAESSTGVPQPPVRTFVTEAPSHTDAMGHRVLDLMPIGDIVRSGNGNWKREGTDLKGVGYPLTIPYEPPEEYDFAVEFEITWMAGGPTFEETFEHAGRYIRWVARPQSPAELAFAFEIISNFGATDMRNPTFVTKAGTLVANKRYTSLIQVRKGALAAYLNQELLIRFATDFTDVTSVRDGIVDGGLRFLSRNGLLIHKIELTEITGKGHYVPPPDDPHLVQTYSTMDDDRSNGGRLVQFTPDGRSLVYMGKDVMMWDRASGKAVLYWHNNEVDPVLQTPAALSPDGRFLAGTLAHRETRFIETARPESSTILNGANMLRGAFSPDGSRLAVMADNRLELWDPAHAKMLGHFDLGKDRSTLLHFIFSPDGQRLLCSHSGVKFKLTFWDAGTMARLWEAPGGQWPYFSRDGTKIISGGKTLLNAADGKVVSEYSDSADQNLISPDGKLVVVYPSFNGVSTLTVCDTATGTLLDHFKDPKIPPLTAATWSADGRWLLIGCNDYTMRLIDVKTGDQRENYGGFAGAVSAVAISPDGKFAAAACSDNKIRVFSLPVK